MRPSGIPYHHMGSFLMCYQWLLRTIFFVHNSAEMRTVVSVGVVALYRTNQMIYYCHMLTTQVSSFLCNYGVRGGLSTLLIFLVISRYHIIIILLPSLPLVLSGGTSAPSYISTF